MRSGPIIQLHTKTVSRKAEIKMEWSLYNNGKYNLWDSDIENQKRGRIQSEWSKIKALPWREDN